MATDPLSAEFATEVAAGYTFDGPTLALGALVQGEEATESAQVGIPLAMMNRHGLVAGATGTGKTRTPQLIAEDLDREFKRPNDMWLAPFVLVAFLDERRSRLEVEPVCRVLT